MWITIATWSGLSREAADLAKVSLEKSVITLGVGLAPPPADAAEEPAIGFPTTSAVVRYNVTPVDGLFLDGRISYTLQFTYMGRVKARLGQFNILTGADTDVIHFDSASFAPAHTFTTNSGTTADGASVLDFVNCAYYVEATLTASAVAVGNPAAIGAVKVVAFHDFFG